MQKMAMSLALLLALLAPSSPALSQAEPTAELEQGVRELMEVTGAGDLGLMIMSQMIGSMKPAMPNVPEEFWTRFMGKVDTDELIDLIVPIYAKHFTQNEIEQLLAFYRTPIGRKVISTLPTVMQESMLAGQQWGERLGLQVAEELEAEGYR